jgi:hypothetical protein
LTWWRLHNNGFPRMAAATRDYLAISVSELAVERLFNKGKDLFSLQKHSLSAETMRKLMLLRDMCIRKETS